MSTDRSGPAEHTELAEHADAAERTDAAERSDAAKRFRRGLATTIGVLAVATVALGAASLAQGPKLADAAVAVDRVTRLADSRLVLELNQPVERVDGDVVVTPAEEAALEVDGRRLILSFERPLPYDEEIAVSITGVVGTAQSAASTVEYRFTTPDEPVFTLLRRSPDGHADVVRRSTVGDPTPEDVLEAPRLRSFAHAGDVIVAASIGDDDTDTLLVTGLGDETQSLALPVPGWVQSIRGSTTQPLIAFTATAQDPADAEWGDRSVLYTLDVSGAAATPEAVLGPDGTPMNVADWTFVPGTSSMAVLDRSGGLSLVDALGLTPAQPLGSHAELRGVLPGTSELVVADPDRGTLIDLSTGESSDNLLPVADLPGEAYPSGVQQLDEDGTHLLDVVLFSTDPDTGGHSIESLVVRVDQAGTVVRYTTGPDSRLLSSCVSPNGRLVAVETASAGAPEDDYRNASSPTGRLTTVVDIDSGDVVLTQNGGFSDWC
ncbi:hypothetical protein [Agromyces sp. NPDC058110]|uniref:hypothetical protein n=1 Tax=Agromyces sp. NPDC058110 TaxID=3346345 RepID=UPI0036DB97D2